MVLALCMRIQLIAHFAYSGSTLPPNPGENCHPFHGKAATDSGEVCHPVTESFLRYRRGITQRTLFNHQRKHMPANRLSMRKNKGSLTPEMGESVKRSQDCEKLSYFTTCGGQLCGTRHVGGLIVALAGSVDGRRVGAVAVSGTPQGG